MNPELEAKLERLFATMEARKAAIRRERENAKLSRRRYWWQEPQTNETPCQENTPVSSSPTE
jgi:hypothetical protein